MASDAESFRYWKWTKDQNCPMEKSHRREKTDVVQVDRPKPSRRRKNRAKVVSSKKDHCPPSKSEIKKPSTCVKLERSEDVTVSPRREPQVDRPWVSQKGTVNRELVQSWIAQQKAAQIKISESKSLRETPEQPIDPCQIPETITEQREIQQPEEKPAYERSYSITLSPNSYTNPSATVRNCPSRIPDNVRQEEASNKRQVCNERIANRYMIIQTRVNPFIQGGNYVTDLSVQDMYLRPRDSNIKEEE